jgi:hypothetical protein
LDKPHILALASETSFLLFKEKVPLKFKKEISAVLCKRKTFQLKALSTPVSFRWTVSLTRGYPAIAWKRCGAAVEFKKEEKLCIFTQYAGCQRFQRKLWAF